MIKRPYLAGSVVIHRVWQFYCPLNLLWSLLKAPAIAKVSAKMILLLLILKFTSPFKQ